MKNFACAIVVFKKNGMYELEVLFVEAKDNVAAWQQATGWSMRQFPAYKGWENHSVVVKEIYEKKEENEH